MYDHAVKLVRDSVDEIAAVAVVALHSLLKNPALSDEVKRPMVDKVMSNVWTLMNDHEKQKQVGRLFKHAYSGISWKRIRLR